MTLALKIWKKPTGFEQSSPPFLLGVRFKKDALRFPVSVKIYFKIQEKLIFHQYSPVNPDIIFNEIKKLLFLFSKVKANQRELKVNDMRGVHKGFSSPEDTHLEQSKKDQFTLIQSKRDLLRHSLSLVSFGLLAACGNDTNFSGVTSKSEANSKKADADGQRIETASTDVNFQRSNSSGEEVFVEKENAEIEVLRGEKIEIDVNPEEPGLIGAGVVDVEKIDDGNPNDILYKLYGRAENSMLAIALVGEGKGLKDGDDILLCKKEGKYTQTISMRNASGQYIGSYAHNFDNLYLKDTQKIYVVIVSGFKMTKYKVDTMPSDFELSYKGKTVINAQAVFAQSSYHDHMPVVTYGVAANTIQSNDLGQITTRRKYPVATQTSLWNDAKIRVNPSDLTRFNVDNNNVNNCKSIEVTDLVGRVLVKANGASLDLPNDFFTKSNNVIIYTNDDDKRWNRFFYFLG